MGHSCTAVRRSKTDSKFQLVQFKYSWYVFPNEPCAVCRPVCSILTYSGGLHDIGKCSDGNLVLLSRVSNCNPSTLLELVNGGISNSVSIFTCSTLNCLDTLCNAGFHQHKLRFTFHLLITCSLLAFTQDLFHYRSLGEDSSVLI